MLVLATKKASVKMMAKKAAKANVLYGMES